jgi:CheY-like chemotaxis protein
MAHKLLLADDSVTIQRVIELTFSGEDVDVFAVSDGEQAIARIGKDRPDIVLADIGMPKRNGYDVAAFIKNDPALRHIPVLLLAGAFEPVDDGLAAEVGCDGVLVKPFEPQHVIARVRELLEGAKGAPARPHADVARPVERLALRAEDRPALRPEDRPAPPAPAPVAAAPRAVEERVPPRPIEFPRREEPRQLPPPTHDRDRVDAFDFAEATTASGESIGTGSPGPDESLDEYFDRLDAAFATLSGVSLPSDERPGDDRVFDDRVEVPTLDDLLASDFGAAPASSIDLPLNTPTVGPFAPKPLVASPPVEPPDATATRTPAPAARLVHPSASTPSEPPAGRIVADAFTALLAVEQGDPGAMPVRLTSARAEPVITDAFVDEVVRRVIQHLSPDVARDVVAEVVSEVAERLVREEIERIRKRQ